MEIRPASITQIALGREGEFIEIDSDVGNVAKDLKEIDPHLCLRYAKAGGYFVVYWRPDDAEPGDGHLVLTAQECDQRIVARVRYINDPSYDYVAELDRIEAEDRKRLDHEWTEQLGEGAERLAHALRKDLGYDKQRIYIPTT